MNAPAPNLDIPEAFNTIKRCVDCAHFRPKRSECGNAPTVSAITGAAGFKDAHAERVWHCDTVKAINFIPTETALAARSVRRVKLHTAVEDAIVDLHPDFGEAVELLDAIKAALGEDGEAPDIADAFDDLRKALNEAGECGPDEMTLAKDDALVDAAQA